MEFTKRTRSVITKIMELLESEVENYEWASDEEEALSDILGQLDDLRRS